MDSFSLSAAVVAGMSGPLTTSPPANTPVMLVCPFSALTLLEGPCDGGLPQVRNSDDGRIGNNRTYPFLKVRLDSRQIP